MPDKDPTRRYLVTARDLGAALEAAQDAGAEIEDRMEAIGLLTVRATPEAALRLSRARGVEAVEPEGEMRTQ